MTIARCMSKSAFCVAGIFRGIYVERRRAAFECGEQRQRESAAASSRRAFDLGLLSDLQTRASASSPDLWVGEQYGRNGSPVGNPKMTLERSGIRVAQLK